MPSYPLAIVSKPSFYYSLAMLTEVLGGLFFCLIIYGITHQNGRKTSCAIENAHMGIDIG